MLSCNRNHGKRKWTDGGLKKFTAFLYSNVKMPKKGEKFWEVSLRRLVVKEKTLWYNKNNTQRLLLSVVAEGLGYDGSFGE